MSHTLPIARPTSAEHAPFALTYIEATATALVEQGSDDVLTLLQTQPAALRGLLAGAGDVLAQQTYALGKWTLGESLLHVSDSERVFSYRLVRIARGDQTPLPGFDQDAWVPNSGAAARTLQSVLHELDAVRSATLALVESLDANALMATGTASGATVSVRALAWIIAGHFAHHLMITRDRYLAANAAG